MSTLAVMGEIKEFKTAAGTRERSLQSADGEDSGSFTRIHISLPESAAHQPGTQRAGHGTLRAGLTRE